MAKQEVMAGMPPPSPGQDRVVETIMYTFFAPLVVYPGWEDEFRARKMEAIAHRVKHRVEVSERQECTEYEAMLYISSATLVAPVEHDWVQVYLWLFQRYRPDVAEANDIVPDRPELDRQQQGKLMDLRRWVFRQQMEHMRRSSRGEQPPQAVSPEKVEVEVVQARLF